MADEWKPVPLSPNTVEKRRASAKLYRARKAQKKRAAAAATIVTADAELAAVRHELAAVEAAAAAQSARADAAQADAAAKAAAQIQAAEDCAREAQALCAEKAEEAAQECERRKAAEATAAAQHWVVRVLARLGMRRLGLRVRAAGTLRALRGEPVRSVRLACGCQSVRLIDTGPGAIAQPKGARHSRRPRARRLVSGPDGPREQTGKKYIL